VTGSPRPQPSGEGAEVAPPPDFVTCRFCPAPAETLCPRCAIPYCALHGGGACDDCARPPSGLPSGAFFRGVIAVFLAAAVLALPLLVVRPRLPGEHPPPSSVAPRRPGPAANPTAAPPAFPGGGGTATPAAPLPQRYTIQAGDTLGAIAVQHGVSVEDLIAANPGIDPQRLQIGAEIVIPPRR